MTTKIKDVYAWADEQEDFWEAITAEKIEQLDIIADSHVQWFNKHTTLNDILSWKRPAVISNNEYLNKQESMIELESPGSIVNEISLIQQDLISKVNDSTDTHIPIKIDNKLHEPMEPKIVPRVIEDDDEIILNPSTKNINNSNNEPTQQSGRNDNIGLSLIEENITLPDNSVSPEINFEESDDIHTGHSLPTSPFAENTASIIVHDISSFIHSPHQSSIFTNTIDNSRSTPELDTDINTQSQKAPTTPKEYNEDRVNKPRIISPKRYKNEEEEEEDDDDEIQLVVAKRHFGDNAKSTVHSPSRNLVNQYANKSPIRTASEHYTSRSPIRNSTQHPNSSTITATPNVSVSPVRYQSPFMSRLFKLAQDSNSRKSNGSVASTNFITVRPKASESTTSITSAKENNKSMSLLENNPKKRPAELIPEPIIEVSDAVPSPRFKKSRTMSARKTNQVNNIPPPAAADNLDDKKEESDQKEHEYTIPSWAKSPELFAHLKNQENIDPDSIFGSIPPLNLEEIFANPEVYLPEECIK